MLPVSSKNYYDILGVVNTASDQEIRTAYKKKALSLHPDKAAQNGLTVERATEAFRLVNKAYKTQKNEQCTTQKEYGK
jgi:curved DNA-binding protein CbpA